MPCVCDPNLYNPNEREEESSKVLELLKEISGQRFNHEQPAEYYGRVSTLDADTARLCAWCSSHDVTQASLELQLWWQRHQKADAKRERQAIKQQQRAAAKAEARAKLTAEERKLLGIE